MRAHDVVALLVQQARGDRRIDPAGHGDQHGRHAVQATAPAVAARTYRDARDRGPLRRPDAARTPSLPPGGSGRRAGSTPARRGARRARGGRTGRGARPVGRRASSPTRRRPASTPPSGPRPRARRPVRPTCRSPGSRCSRGARRPSCPSPAGRPSRRCRRGHAGLPSIDRSDYDAAIGRIHRAHRRRRHLPGQLHAAAPRDASTATRGASTATSASRSAAPTAAYLDAGRFRVCRPRRSCSSGSTGGTSATQADEGHRAARPLARRGRGDRAPARAAR